MPELSTAEQKFILHWGEMGNRWGINRTVSQIHALLIISPKPLNAEEIATTLSVARSNVSTSIRELQGWGVIKTVPILGDRREHYESIQDFWDLFWIVTAERKRREIDPTLAMLTSCLAEMEADPNPKNNHYTRKRLEDLHDFVQMLSGCYDQMALLPRGVLKSYFKNKACLSGLMEKLLKVFGAS